MSLDGDSSLLGSKAGQCDDSNLLVKPILRDYYVNRSCTVGARWKLERICNGCVGDVQSCGLSMAAA